MAVKRFRTKIVEIEAIQWTGDNLDELTDWAGPYFASRSQETKPEFDAAVYDTLHETWILVKNGQWIVRGAKGEYYPCDDETFHWKYEEVKFAEGGYVESGGLINLYGCVVSPNEIRRRKGMEER